MSTRSFIARQVDDNSYRAIYCHMDGYLSYNGAMLLDNYNTPEKIDELLNLGDLSYLAERLNPDPLQEHLFDGKRQEGVTLAYGRDRGEPRDRIEAKIYSMDELKDVVSGTDYCYVFTQENEWKYFRPFMSNDVMHSVEDDINQNYQQYGISQRPEGYYGFLTKEIAEDMKAEIAQQSEGEVIPVEQE